jgi:hypothetical protein
MATPKTCYVMRRMKNADDLVAWALEQGFTKTLDPKDIHVTVVYSRDKIDWDEAGDSFDELRVGVGILGRSVVALGDKGAVVLKFEHGELHDRWQEFRDIGASWDFPSYQPHVSITYDGKDMDLSKIIPYDGEIVFGPEEFSELDEDWGSKVVEKSAPGFTPRYRLTLRKSQAHKGQPRVPAGRHNGGQWTHGFGPGLTGTNQGRTGGGGAAAVGGGLPSNAEHNGLAMYDPLGLDVKAHLDKALDNTNVRQLHKRLSGKSYDTNMEATKEERDAFNYYRDVSSIARGIPMLNREGKEIPPDQKARDAVPHLTKLIAKHGGLSEDVTVYRSFRNTEFVRAADKLTGRTFTDPGFMSTTLNPAIAKKFYEGKSFTSPSNLDGSSTAVVMRLKVPKEHTAMYMNGDASGKGSYEHEVLMPRNSTFRIDKVTRLEEGGILVDGEFIPSP